MRENTKRERAFHWVLFKILRHKDSNKMKWYEILVRYFFMPLNTFWFYLDKHNNVLDEYGQTIRLLGVDYSTSLFRAVIKPGNIIKILQNENGRIVFEELTETKNSQGAINCRNTKEK